MREEAALAELEWLLSGPHTLEAIATRLGLSRERVRILERQAMAKLRRAAARDRLTFDDLLGVEHQAAAAPLVPRSRRSVEST